MPEPYFIQSQPGIGVSGLERFYTHIARKNAQAGPEIGNLRNTRQNSAGLWLET